MECVRVKYASDILQVDGLSFAAIYKVGDCGSANSVTAIAILNSSVDPHAVHRSAKLRFTAGRICHYVCMALQEVRDFAFTVFGVTVGARGRRPAPIEVQSLLSTQLSALCSEEKLP